MYTLEKCEKLWEKDGQHGTTQQRIGRAELWEPYYNMTSAPLLEADFPREIPNPPFVDYLIREGVLTHESSVLDIGAGVGSYALPFARFCRKVAALEPVAACLDVLEYRKKEWGLENIEAIRDFWETFRSEGKYDVTFASMCPAICNAEELRRMEAMTEKACCLVAVQRGSYEKHRKAMMTQMQIKPQGMTTEAIHYINALYLMGRQPNVKCLESRQMCRISVSKIMEWYPVYFHIFGIPKSDAVSFLKQYLAQNAVDGFLEEEICLKQALIYWNV